MKYWSKLFRLYIGDAILLIVSYVIVLLWKSGSFDNYLFDSDYYVALIIFASITLVTSSMFGKYAIIGKTKFYDLVIPIVKSNVMILGLVSLIIYFLQLYTYSRLIVLGTVYLLTVFELIGIVFYYFIQKTTKEKAFESEGVDVDYRYMNDVYLQRSDKNVQEVEYTDAEIKDLETSFASLNQFNKELIVGESGERVYEFISKYVEINSSRCGIFSTTTKFNIDKQPNNFLRSIINLHKINDIRRINKFFESVNTKLTLHGNFICCVETKNMRKKRIFNKFPPGISHIYYLIDFLYKRVWPKLPGLNKIYFFLSRGLNRVLSKQEVMGRLYSCGFILVNEAVIDNLQYFIVEKVKKPVYDFQPSYGPIFKMRRVGKEGKIIYVYKFRTMYPYSEYLQKYIYENHNLDEGGKFDRDIRITTLGKFFRKFWLDEFPMLINWIRGDLKLVGVRPLSEHYLSLYTDELRRFRWKYKPGLLPPYYADMPKKIEDIMASEMKYLQAYNRSPFMTDFRYFFIILFNIIFKKARSK